MRLPYRGPDTLSCVRHYASSNQRGGAGAYPVFSGSRYQRGSGIGDIFGSVWRAAVPFLKRTAASAGRYALKSGQRLLEDIEQGKSLKEAAGARLAEAKQDALNKVLGQSGSGRKRRRKKQLGGRRRVKRIVASSRRGDIFGPVI